MPLTRRPTWLTALGAVVGVLALTTPAAASGISGSGVSQALAPTPIPADELDSIVADVTTKMAAEERSSSAGAEADPTPDPTPGPAALPAPDDPTDIDLIEPDPVGYGIPPSAAQFALTPDSAAQAGGEEPGRRDSRGAAYSIPRPAAGGGGAGAIPEGLESFYTQELTWEPCADFNGPTDLECTYVIAPLDYSAPQEETIAIAVSRAEATEGPATGTIMATPGGPGIGGIAFAGADQFAELNETFDIVGFDPRGVGASLPNIRCQSNDAWDRQRQGADALTSEDVDAIVQHNTSMCYRHSGPEFGIEDFLDHAGTVEAANDLDLVRSALGEAELNYLGFGYGASLGYEYSRQFPDNIRAVVMDGVIDPLTPIPQDTTEHTHVQVPGADTGTVARTARWQATFDQYLRWCTDLGEQCALTGEGEAGGTSQLLQRYQELARAAWGGQTYAADDGRAISFDDFTNATLMALHDEELWPALNRGLAQIQQDPTNAEWLITLADHYAGRGENGSYTLARAAYPTISCLDSGTHSGSSSDADAQDSQDAQGAQREMLQEHYAAAPFADPRTEAEPDRGMTPRVDACMYYEETGSRPAAEALQAMPNTLTIAATDSPSTPLERGAVAANTVGGTLLIAAGTAPTSYGNTPCATSTANAYFRTLRVPTQFTGEENVPTKDVESGLITGDECTVASQFRPQSELGSGAGAPGDTVTLDASGLVRGTEYVVDWKYASLPLTSDARGRSSIELPIPPDAEPGTYTLTLSPGLEEENDPAVYAKGSVTVTPR